MAGKKVIQLKGTNRLMFKTILEYFSKGEFTHLQLLKQFLADHPTHHDYTTQNRAANNLSALARAGVLNRRDGVILNPLIDVPLKFNNKKRKELLPMAYYSLVAGIELEEYKSVNISENTPPNLPTLLELAESMKDSIPPADHGNFTYGREAVGRYINKGVEEC